MEETKRAIFSEVSFFENPAIYEIIWKKYSLARQATDDNMAHARYMLDTLGYKRTSGYVTLITVPVKQSLPEIISILRYSTLQLVRFTLPFSA